MDDGVRMHDADVALDAEVPCAGGKDGGHQHGRRGIVAGLVAAELRHEVRAPRLVVLAVVDDATARRALVPHVVQDVGAELAAADPLEGVVAERGPEVGLEIALGAVTELVRRLLLECTLRPFRPASARSAIRLRLRLQEGAVGRPAAARCRASRCVWPDEAATSRWCPRSSLRLVRSPPPAPALLPIRFSIASYSRRVMAGTERAFLGAFHPHLCGGAVRRRRSGVPLRMRARCGETAGVPVRRYRPASAAVRADWT